MNQPTTAWALAPASFARATSAEHHVNVLSVLHCIAHLIAAEKQQSHVLTVCAGTQEASNSLPHLVVLLLFFSDVVLTFVKHGGNDAGKQARAPFGGHLAPSMWPAPL